MTSVNVEQIDPWLEPRPRRRWLGFVLFLVFIAIGTIVFVVWSRFAARDAVEATIGRLTFAEDDGGSLAIVDRRDGPEIWYRVTLHHAPIGQRIDLRCEWIDSAGRVAHRNRYETREITKSDWPTYARFRIDPDAPPGTWSVRMLLDHRVLHEMNFEVRDGPRADEHAKEAEEKKADN